MLTSITQLATQAVVLAMAIYLCWPALMESLPKTVESAPQANAKKPANGFASLSPKFSPLSKRDPFLASDEKHSTTAKSGKSKNGAKTGGAKEVNDINDTGLVLNATCIVGNHRLALINGRIYREKETIAASNNEPANCILTNIYPHKVLLSWQGKPLQLSYVNTAAKPVASKAPRKTAN